MTEIPKSYSPTDLEEKWYAFWLDQGCFRADSASTKPSYSIVIPPPNVTGVLTLGHVLNNTIQDILARKARMEGQEVLWLPGTDHAGIATQTAVEKALKKQGRIRHRDDLGREAFLEQVWEWKEKHGGIIIQQLKKLGASCDWSRERFTMDPAYSACVQKVFVDLFRKGLIYRGRRMVNWCPVSLTALSDEEVVMKPQKGVLYRFRVAVVNGAGQPVVDDQGQPMHLEIATTRPETIPGDTAIAVHPEDPRYRSLIGQFVVRPLPVGGTPEEKRIPIVADAHIDPAFGTGVLKVTPAHDKADFEIGQRHHLPVVEVIDPHGVMNGLAGPDLAGLERFQARKAAAELLRAQGALVEESPYQNNVGFSERADVPIEPRLSEQWFLRYPSTEPARECVADGRMRFFPDRWAKVYDHWMANLQDWCISRQLWWGHRVPVWRRSFPSGDPAHAALLADLPETSPVREQPLPDGSVQVEVATTDPSAIQALETRGFEQDTDVLDTWFSSWLWPFATMGWPEKTATLRKFYPTTDLVTGPDIIFFWVARMIMAGYEFMGEMPFRNVYFTGIIRDKQGRKMSKSLGNSPDPLELIARYGADGLRFGIMRSAPQGQDVMYDEQNVELGRNFCTKLWNACRFRQMQGGVVQGEIHPDLLTSDDRWILHRLDQTLSDLHQSLAEYRFNEATAVLYRFFWNEYCDWYIEASKAALAIDAGSAQDPSTSEGSPADGGQTPNLRANKLAVLDFILSHTLRMFHPFLPFITEELWHSLGYASDMPESQGGRTVSQAPWPRPFSNEERTAFGLDASVLQLNEAKFELVTLGRHLKSQFQIPSNKRVAFVLKPAGDLDPAEIPVLATLLHAESLTVQADYQPPRGTPVAINALGELFLPLAGLIDVAAERQRLAKEAGKIADEIRKVETKLANPSFVDKVPPAVLEEHRQRLADWQAKAQQVQSALDHLPAE